MGGEIFSVGRGNITMTIMHSVSYRDRSLSRGRTHMDFLPEWCEWRGYRITHLTYWISNVIVLVQKVSLIGSVRGIPDANLLKTCFSLWWVKCVFRTPPQIRFRLNFPRMNSLEVSLWIIPLGIILLNIQSRTPFRPLLEVLGTHHQGSIGLPHQRHLNTPVETAKQE